MYFIIPTDGKDEIVFKQNGQPSSIKAPIAMIGTDVFKSENKDELIKRYLDDYLLREYSRKRWYKRWFTKTPNIELAKELLIGVEKSRILE